MYRYSSRAILIPFEGPSLKPIKQEERMCYQFFLSLFDDLSTSAAFIIQFVEQHNEVVVNHFEPKVMQIFI